MSSVGFVLCVCCLGAVLGCTGPVAEVDGISPARRDIESALTTNGRIEAEQAVAVRAGTSGRVGKLYVRRGVEIERGEPLLQLLDSGQAAARTRARARLAAAKARLVQLEAGLDPRRKVELISQLDKLEADRSRASEDLDRLRRLAALDAAAPSEVDAHERIVQDLARETDAVRRQLEAPPLDGRRSEFKSAIEEADAELRAAEQSVETLMVRAPASGTLFSLAVAEGDFLEHGSLAARIGITDRVKTRVFVDEPELGRVTQGSVARISADAYPGREWDCRVETLATEVVEIGPRRVGEVLCQAENPDRLLLPGLAVRVRVVTQRAEDVLSVPRAAVMRGDEAPYLWVVEDGRAVKREVILGVAGPVFVEVASGLAESDSVALPADQGLTAGQRVRLRPAIRPGSA